MNFDARAKLFVVLAAVFCTCLVTGDIIGSKLIDVPVLGTMTTVGMVPFPVTFLLTDLLNEFYGKRATRFITWLGFFMASLAFVFIFVGGAIPIAALTRSGDWTGVTEQTFANVFLGSQRMIVASMVAYLFAQFVDIFVFHQLKLLTANRHLWLRATGSTAIAQLVDTATISFVAWTGTLPVADIVAMIFTAYGLKLLIAFGLTPFVYLGHALVERSLGLRPVLLDERGEPILQV
jgi:queuosine precursor transporter